MRRRIRPRPGQESVWDYPRPPRVEPVEEPVKIVHNGVVIAKSEQALRVLETASPPAFYVPAADVKKRYLRETTGHTVCEFKGVATYYDLSVNNRIAPRAAWSYLAPKDPYAELAGYLSFYAGKVDSAYVGDEKVTPQEGDYYGGWITSKVVGPFKGAAGTYGW